MKGDMTSSRHDPGDATLESHRRPLPSVVLAVFSVAVIVACLFVASVALAMLFVTWDLCILASGVILLPVPVFLGLHQYWGTFRRSRRGATITGCFLVVIGSLMAVLAALVLGEMLIERVKIPWLGLILPLACASGLALFAGGINFNWSRQLQDRTLATENSPTSGRFSLRELLLAISAIAFVVFVVNSLARTNRFQFAEQVSRDEVPFSLPDGAHDISYCHGVRGTIAYEFSIDEPGFVNWVASGIGTLESEANNVPLRPIVAPYTIRRCYALSHELKGPDSVTIASGLYYHWSQEDRGVYAAYDRTTGRAYYWFNAN
jgi:MFS family permease